MGLPQLSHLSEANRPPGRCGKNDFSLFPTMKNEHTVKQQKNLTVETMIETICARKTDKRFCDENT